jgi:hypothetical protein
MAFAKCRPQHRSGEFFHQGQIRLETDSWDTVKKLTSTISVSPFG